MINQTCSLILRDLYSYDIQSAFATILQKQQYDFQGTDLENKTERSIFMGKQQIDNQNLSSFLSESTESLIKYYLLENSVPDEDVIITQKDGFIIKKLLENNNEFIEMKFREYIDFLILSIDRKKFMYCVDGKITIKGVPYYYEELDKVYLLFASLNFYDKSILFDQLENIKQTVLQSTSKKLFLIPKDDTSFIVSTYKGDIEVKDPDMISIQSINKMKYYDHFFKDFLSSIFLEMY